MSDETVQDVPVAGEIVHYDDEIGMERLSRRPIIDRIDARALALIQSTVAPGCTLAEVGHFLELCAVYGLDPFAREAWCAKNKRGDKLLIMVGRDGLRKIAKRNGLGIDGDVVREGDTYSVHRKADRTRDIEHVYREEVTAEAKQARGPVMGAWAECYDLKSGEQRGYFYAPLSEYKPSNASEYSPWSKQESVMILAAAERQAIRQATPLGGLLAEGEDESANAQRTVGAGEGDGSEPGWGETDPDVVLLAEALISRATRLGHAGLSDRATIQMRVLGQPNAVALAWIAEQDVALDVISTGEAFKRAVLEVSGVEDAEVVDGDAAMRENDPETVEGGGEQAALDVDGGDDEPE